jgi:hypothetical protein
MKYEAGLRYRMPVMFGPSISPRQGPGGVRYDSSQAPKTLVTATFLTDELSLEPLLPPGFSLRGEPTVTIEFTYFTKLEWLAGRGYNTLGVKIPVRYGGRRDSAAGMLLLVLWENMPEPIITGREELGFAKLYCEIPAARIIRGAEHYSARWDGHEFIRLTLSQLSDAAAPPSPSGIDGLLHYRYVPKVGAPGEADCEHAVLTPFGGAPLITDRYRTASATLECVHSTWEQVPTMYMVINALAAFPLREFRSASIAEQRGGKDLSDQRALY